MKCSTIEKLPALAEDPKPGDEPDPLLMNVVGRHGHVTMFVGGGDPDMQLLNVSEKDWNNPRTQKEILGNLQKRWSGFHPEFYHTKDTFQEDALHCFNRHSRPKGGCIDWEDDSKKLTPDSWKKGNVYLCHFCPVASTVTTMKRLARGDYNKQPGETD